MIEFLMRWWQSCWEQFAKVVSWRNTWYHSMNVIIFCFFFLRWMTKDLQLLFACFICSYIYILYQYWCKKLPLLYDIDPKTNHENSINRICCKFSVIDVNSQINRVQTSTRVGVHLACEEQELLNIQSSPWERWGITLANVWTLIIIPK